MFTLTAFEILLFEGRLVLAMTQRDTGIKKVKEQLHCKCNS